MLTAQRWTKGEWTVAANAANTTFNPTRATGQATAAQLMRACKLVGFSCFMANLGIVIPVAGGIITVQVIRQPITGSPTAAVTIGTILVGESNVSKAVVQAAGSEIQFAAGELVYVVLVTAVGYTSTTCVPKISLEFEEV